MISNDTVSASKSNTSDSDDGRDDGANKVFHLIEVHQFFR